MTRGYILGRRQINSQTNTYDAYIFFRTHKRLCCYSSTVSLSLSLLLRTRKRTCICTVHNFFDEKSTVHTWSVSQRRPHVLSGWSWPVHVWCSWNDREEEYLYVLRTHVSTCRHSSDRFKLNCHPWGEKCTRMSTISATIS